MTWRHVTEKSGQPGVCGVCWDSDKPNGAVCTQAKPDSWSPCGYDGCGEPESYHEDFYPHPHQPTRCLTCGHPIEEALP